MIEGQIEPESNEWKSRRRKASFRRAFTETLLAGLFVISMLLARYLSKQEFSNAQYLAATFPIIALTIWWWISARRIIQLEELERAIAVNSLAIAFVLIIWLATSYGLLAQLSGLPEIQVIFIAPAAAFIWQMVWFALSIRYS